MGSGEKIISRVTKGQLTLQESACDLAETAFKPTAAATDLTEAYPWDSVARLRDNGFIGMTIPTALGGRSLSCLDSLLVIEEMARCCLTMGRIIVEANMGAIGAVMKYGSEGAKASCRRLCS